MGKRENYSRNQCTLIIRIDGEELEIPVNFGLSANEIRAIYPYLAKLANTKIVNPALKFSDDSEKGRYSGISEEEYAKLVEAYHKQSEYWYQKPDASLLDLAVRFALDIQFKGIQEIQDAFSTVTPFEHIMTERTVSKEEADRIMKDTGMGSDADVETETDDEKDVEMGTAGSVPVDIYGTGDSSDFLSKELDDMNAAHMEDRFEKIVNGGSDRVEVPDRYKSNYRPAGLSDDQIDDKGLLDLYAMSGSADAIFGDEPDDGSTAAEIFGDDNPSDDLTGKADSMDEEPDDDLEDYEEDGLDEDVFDEMAEEPEIDGIDEGSED